MAETDLNTVLNTGTLSDALDRFHIPGAAIAVQQGNFRSSVAAGFADVPSGVEVSDETLFQIGSITKVFTATLLCKLSESGEVDLEAPVSRYLPDLRISGEHVPDEMTIRTLLDYSCGIEGQFFEDFGDSADALRQYVDACSGLRLIHPPGSMRGYNSTSYCIAGRVIEAVTGEPFDDVLAARLLEPLGISQYSFYDVNALGPEHALGHHWDPESGAFKVDDKLRLPRSMSPAGSSVSLTAEGLLAFASMHLGDGVAADGRRYLDADTVRMMRTPSRTVPPDDSELLLGWAAMPLGEDRLTIAAGRTIGQNAFVMLAPQQDFAMSLQANSAMGGEQLFVSVGLEVIESLTGCRLEMPSPSAAPGGDEGFDIDARRYIGTYANPAKIKIQEDEGGLKLVSEYKDNSTESTVSYASTMHPTGHHNFTLVLDGTDQVIGSATFLFEDPGRDQASHVYTSRCLFGRI
ncbi:MAG: serine hydrolase domain-containing protein [Xanthomonadales bacterium]|nr:serine hydrolase domain-containing protein [Xanthomonadales bacterium]